jgi:hypothetical protein
MLFVLGTTSQIFIWLEYDINYTTLVMAITFMLLLF